MLNMIQLQILTSFVLTIVSLSHAHMLWQQNAMSHPFGYFTFGELPGSHNAADEQVTEILFEKGISIRFTDVSELSMDNISGNNTYQMLDSTLEGRSILFDFPGAPKAYVIEGFCEWGLWAEGGKNPSLLRYYTSSSKELGYRERAQEALTNKFGVRLETAHLSKMCEGLGGSQNGKSVCIRVSVRYDLDPVPNTEVKVFNGGNNYTDPQTLVTDEDGITYISVLNAYKRLYAQTKFDVETPGETPDGDKYESITNYATTVIELYHTATKSNSTTQEDKKADGTEERYLSIDFFTVLVVILASCIGSFIGSILSDKLCKKSYRHYTIPADSESDLQLELQAVRGEPC